MMTLSQDLLSIWAPFSVAVAVVAFLCCVIANWQNRRQGYVPEAPSVVMGICLVLTLAWASGSVVHANVLVDYCWQLEPGSWAWYLAGCFW